MDNLHKAAEAACKVRKDKDEVDRFLDDSEALILKLRQDLIDGTYVPSEFTFFTKMENGKVREISNQPLYPDRIACQAVAQVLEPLLDGRLIPQTHASRKGHGTHNAIEDIKGYLEKDTRIRYAFKGDVKKYFPSIPKQIASMAVRHVIKDRKAVWFIETAVIYAYKKPGIPLGNRLSPLIANLVLSFMLVYKLKQEYRVHYIVVYMDDFVILGYSKEWLHKIQKISAMLLEEGGLTLKGNWQIFPIEKRGIDFVGYVVYRDKVLLRPSTKRKLIAKCRIIQARADAGFPLDEHDQGTIWSYNGMLDWCDSHGLRKITTGPLVQAIESERRWIVGIESWRFFAFFFSEVYI